ncbi:MAG: hypothetical protein ACYC0H_21280 [Solirubrobacteraceae bacterium]
MRAGVIVTSLTAAAITALRTVIGPPVRASTTLIPARRAPGVRQLRIDRSTAESARSIDLRS